MPLFKKNPNEAAYQGGKKHFIDVIKNTGPGNQMIWRQPEEDFNTNSTLIVMPGEYAVFVKGGNIEETFEEGTYKLSTQNYPFISRLRNALSGGISTFNCVVYFVRKADSEEIKWGTQTPIQIRDKAWGIRTDVRARGAYRYRIENPATFLQKLVGSNNTFETQDVLLRFLQQEMQGQMKSAVARFLNGLNRELIGIDEHLVEIAKIITPEVEKVFQEYGLHCVNFSLAALDVDTSKYESLDESNIIAQKRAMEAQGERARLDALGTDYHHERGFDVLQDLANNEGVGNYTNMGAGMGIGMGMGMGMGSMFGGMANQLLSPAANINGTPQAQQPQQPGQPAQGGAGPYSRFAPKPEAAPPPVQPAAPVQAPQEDPMEVLGKLKKMLDAGFITQAEYDAKKNEILSRM